jgi:hypothetical protein
MGQKYFFLLNLFIFNVFITNFDQNRLVLTKLIWSILIEISKHQNFFGPGP